MNAYYLSDTAFKVVKIPGNCEENVDRNLKAINISLLK